MKGKLSVKAFINSNLKNKDTINSLYIRVVYNKKTTSIPFVKVVFGQEINASVKIDLSSNLSNYESIALYNITNIMNFLSTINKDDISILSDVIDKLNKKISDVARYLIYQIVEMDILDTSDSNKIEKLASLGKMFICRAFFVEFVAYDLNLHDFIFSNTTLLQERIEQVKANLQSSINALDSIVKIPEDKTDSDINFFRKEIIKYLIS